MCKGQWLFHSWEKWGEPFIGLPVSGGNKTQLAQRRLCSACGFAEYRILPQTRIPA